MTQHQNNFRQRLQALDTPSIADAMDSLGLYPLFSSAVFMYSGKNRVRLCEKQITLQIGPTEVQPGDWLVADSSGALAIPATRIEDVLLRAERINATEQKIRAALREGVPLEQARATYRYDRPWEEATAA